MEKGTATEFPVPEFDDASCAFGASEKDYLTREEMGDEFYRMSVRNNFTEAASSLFFTGGKLEDYGLKLKPEIDSIKAHRAIRALLCSFAPKHEIKIGTVGFALSKWCDPIATQHGET